MNCTPRYPVDYAYVRGMLIMHKPWNKHYTLEHILNNKTATIDTFLRMIGRSCNELQANLVMIEHHYVAFNHKIPNQNNMSIVKLKSICVWISH